jgi:hypothetical protein
MGRARIVMEFEFKIEGLNGKIFDCVHDLSVGDIYLESRLTQKNGYIETETINNIAWLIDSVSETTTRVRMVNYGDEVVTITDVFKEFNSLELAMQIFNEHKIGDVFVKLYYSKQMELLTPKKNKEEPLPQVGMGATLVVGSDSYPYTITWVSKSGKSFKMKQDNYQRTDKRGFSESQDYEYTPNEKAQEETVTLRKGGAWRQSHSNLRVWVGVKRAYYDLSV